MSLNCEEKGASVLIKERGKNVQVPILVNVTNSKNQSYNPFQDDTAVVA